MKIVKLVLSIYILLGIIFIPFPFNLFPYQSVITEFVFGGVTDFIAELLGISFSLNDFSSDSKRLFILTGVLLVFSLLISTLIFQFKTPSEKLNKYYWYFQKIAIIYIACIMLKYGFDKVFKCQFYLPEPNILHSKVGSLDKDILYWSTMGCSKGYSIFMGLTEIIPGILLLFSQTRKLGLIITIGVLINVIAVNFSFDISVKLFSSFLMLISLYLISPFLPALWKLLTNQNVSSLEKQDPIFHSAKKNEWKKILKVLVIVVVIIESLYPYIKSGNFNDDKFPRPFLHGAYEIQYSLIEGDTISKCENKIKMIFVHRDNYLIFQDENDNMYDYKLAVDQLKNEFTLTDYELNNEKYSYSFNENSGILKIKSILPETNEIIYFKKFNQKMTLLQPLFHLTVD